MKKYSRENLKAIQAIVQEKTGAVIVSDRKTAGYKIGQWSTGEEVEGDSEKIRMSGLTIAPHSKGITGTGYRSTGTDRHGYRP